MADTKITAETIKAAVRDAEAGREYEKTDPYCEGLQLRVRGREVTFTVRARLFGNQRRWVIGDATTKPDVARERAAEVRAWCRRGQNPEKLITEFQTGISIAHQIRVAGERPPPSWRWQKSVDAFMNHILAVRSPETYDDYAGTLGGRKRQNPTERLTMVPELRRFADRDVAGISREEIAECVADVFHRNESAGAHLKRVLGSLWTFLGDDSRRRHTSVPANLLLRLKTPESARRLRGDPNVLFTGDKEDLRRDVPPPLAMGRALAIAPPEE